ncbi:hypothetical protein QVD17_37505 [Tagetes erecta]|uniref:Uncharacterized protein n=1 Tax=Tagetes erecta TaxID=13708 RepID=A0AAD8JUQ9_TARER|nr:hypothetical protein QVD17_37505 [Tagetes erecta]
MFADATDDVVVTHNKVKAYKLYKEERTQNIPSSISSIKAGNEDIKINNIPTFPSPASSLFSLLDQDCDGRFCSGYQNPRTHVCKED